MDNPAEKPSPPDGQNKGTSKLLLFDSKEADRKRIGNILAESKFELQGADSFDEGLALLKSEPYNLALVSCEMIEDLGAEAVRKIHGMAPNIPVVFLDETEDPQRALTAVRHGAQDYIVKNHLDAPLLIRVIQHSIDREHLNSEMWKKNKELKRLNALKSEFISTVSHELKTPLTVILSAANNFLKGNLGALKDEQKKWLKKIHQHAMRLQKMISELLDLSKLQSGKMSVNRLNIKIGPFIEKSVSNIKILAVEKNVFLTTEISPNMPSVWIDAGRMERVFNNLITNAIKFTPSGGTIKVLARMEGSYVFASVEDNGPGISAEHLEEVFERFKQVRAEEMAEGSLQGIGLGLAICKEIIGLHKGRIWVESNPGKGSRFNFMIPIDPRSASAIRNILLVDDDEEVCELLKVTLNGAGYAVTVARTGQDAIRNLSGGGFDLAFVDLRLPQGSGLDVIKTARQMKRSPSLVVITAYTNSDLLFQAMATGPLTVIAKPFQPKDIVEAVQRLAAGVELDDFRSQAV